MHSLAQLLAPGRAGINDAFTSYNRRQLYSLIHTVENHILALQAWLSQLEDLYKLTAPVEQDNGTHFDGRNVGQTSRKGKNSGVTFMDCS